MRLSKEEQDIVKMICDNEPMYIVERAVDIDSLTINNIFGVQNYIFTRNGKHAKHRTLLGKIALNAEDNVLYGDLNVKCRGEMYHVFLNNMIKALHIICIYYDGHIKCWSNCQTTSTLRKLNNELPIEIVNKLFEQKYLQDYGESVQKFITECRSIIAVPFIK